MITCLAVRAVYVDVAADQTTDGFLQVLRRFASRHGWPKKFYSDGGTQLVGASKELQEQAVLIGKKYRDSVRGNSNLTGNFPQGMLLGTTELLRHW